MSALFWVLAAALAAAGIGFLAWPLLRAAPPARLDRRTATLAAHRARLAEIEAGDEGAAEDAATGREARDDVARSLLRDLDPESRPPGPSTGFSATSAHPPMPPARPAHGPAGPPPSPSGSRFRCSRPGPTSSSGSRAGSTRLPSGATRSGWF